MPKPQPPESYRKNCTLCNKPRDVLVRCQIDPQTPILPAKPSSSSSSSPSPTSPTSQPNPSDPSTTTTTTTTTVAHPSTKSSSTWHFVCPGSCWQRVSGGVIDGDLSEGRRGYRYGGMWKNRHAGVSAKVPRRLKGKLGREGGGNHGGRGEKVEEEQDEGKWEEGDGRGA